VAKDNKIFLHSTNKTELNEMKIVLLEALKGSAKSSKCINLPPWTLSVLIKEGQINEVKRCHKDIQCSFSKGTSTVRFIGPKDSIDSALKQLKKAAFAIALNMATLEVELKRLSFDQLASKEKDFKMIEKKTNCLVNYSDRFVKYASVAPRDGVVVDLFLGDMTRLMHADLYVCPLWNEGLVQKLRRKAGKTVENVSGSGSRIVNFTESGSLSHRLDSVTANVIDLDLDGSDSVKNITDLLDQMDKW